MQSNGMTPPWLVLLVEDDEEDYLLTKTYLKDMNGHSIHLEWVTTYAEGLEKIASSTFDVALVDYNLGDQNGLDLTREARQRGYTLPIILLTGHGNYEIDLLAMKAGATDYLSKGEATPLLLERAIRYAIEHKQHEEALLDANRQLGNAKSDLETRVHERTIELLRKNESLEAEIMRRKIVEAELAELQRRLIDSTEAERLALAQELHDGPMQDLYGITYQMDSVRNGISAEDRDQQIAAIQNDLQSVIQTLRATAGELRPPTLTAFGLEKAIRSHAENAKRSQPDLRIRLNLMPDRQRLPDRVRLALFRIYQVSLANVIRHAGASQVEVCLLLQKDQVVLEIKDDGRGFSVPDRLIQLARKGHLGLVGASERAEAVGGKMEIISTPGEGTLIRVEVPLENIDR
jgi:signal transduction histidine kinase